MTKIEQMKAAGLQIIEAESDEKAGSYSFTSLTNAEMRIFENIINPQPPQTETVFDLPLRTPAIYAADYFVSSPRVKDDPLEAIRDAINEAVKKDKSLALIVLSLAKGMIYLLDYIDKTDKRLDKAKIK